MEKVKDKICPLLHSDQGDQSLTILFYKLALSPLPSLSHKYCFSFPITKINFDFFQWDSGNNAFLKRNDFDFYNYF